MKRVHINWYIFIVFDLFFSLLVMITLFEILSWPTQYAELIVLDLIGLFLVLHSVLYKLNYIDYPDYIKPEKVSEDEDVQRRYHFYANLIMGIVLLLGSVYYLILNQSGGLRFVFLVSIMRVYAYKHVRKKENKKNI
ncbi:MAG: hypothetical protein FH756_18595 [Firmicutes bacterium]|nr:hypothetical protein [Bacillota bacterium]